MAPRSSYYVQRLFAQHRPAQVLATRLDPEPGEGGIVVGAPLRGRTVIVDDVITDGASKRESVELIRREGATPVAVLIALDRMERGGTDDKLSSQSAVKKFERDHGLPVISIATLADLLDFLDSDDDSPLAAHFDAVARYRDRYGA